MDEKWEANNRSNAQPQYLFHPNVGQIILSLQNKRRIHFSTKNSSANLLQRENLPTRLIILSQINTHVRISVGCDISSETNIESE